MIDAELSPFGRERRDQILNMAIQQGRWRRRRRLAIRGGAVVITLLAIGAAVLRLQHTTLHPSERSIVESLSPPAPAPHRALAATFAIERIQTDPTIARRLAVPQSPPRWQRLDDDHLLQELAQAGKPAGLIKIDGQAALLFHRLSR
jgi:hypothetical protein